MNALIEPLAGDDAPTPTHSLCPVCGTLFKFRRNKTYCSRTCKNTSHRRRDRRDTPANAAVSYTKARQQAEKFDLAMRMAERLYTMPPAERLEYLETVIRLARDGHAPLVRDILTTPMLLRPAPSDRYLFYRKSPRSYCTITQAANRYTIWSSWAAPVDRVVKGEVPEPPTGEVREDGSVDDDGRGFLSGRKKGDTLNKRGPSGRTKVHPWYGLGDEYPHRMRRFVPEEKALTPTKYADAS